MFNMPNISCRFFNVYGPRLNVSSQYSAVIGNFLSQTKSKKALTVVGDGKQTRDFIHVDDLVNAFIKIIKSKFVNKIYNLGSGKELQLILLLRFLVGKKSLYQSDPVSLRTLLQI